MRIVDLYKMSEDEQKKALQEQQAMYNERMQQSDEIRRQANQQFNNLISKQGEYDTTRHTTTIGNLRNAYKNSSNYNKLNDSLNRIYLNSENSIWNKMQNIMTFNKTNNQRNNNIDIKNNGIDNWTTANNMAKQNNDKVNMIATTQTAKSLYEEKQKKAIKNTVEYNLIKSKNPNMSEEELIEKTKLETENKNKQFNETFTNMSKEERQKEIYKIQNMLNDKEGLFETDNKKIQNKQFINNLRTKSEAIEAEKEAERVNKILNEGNFLERATTATGELAGSMGKSAIDMTLSPIVAVGSLAEEVLPTDNFKGTRFDDIVDYKKIKDRAETVKNANIENEVLKAGKGVSSTIGGMIPSIIANIVLPGSNVGMIAQASGVAGEDYIENLNEDKSNKLQSAFSGTLKGLGSYATEKITGGNILGKGSLDDWATRTIANGTSKIENETLKKITQKIASKIYEVGGENFEELLENQIDHLVDTTVNNKGITFKEWLDEQSETVKQTTLTQLFLNLMGVGGDTYNEVQKYSQNAEMKQWINEAQKIIDKENLNIDNYKINNNNINEVRKTLNELPIENATANLQQQSTQSEQILPTQQITQEQNNIAQNGNTEQIMSTQNENRKIAIDEINNSRISTQEKQQMIEALNSIEEVSNEDIYAIRNVINEANKINQLPTDLNYKDNREARQKYAKYKNDNSNYDSIIVNEVLDTIPTNRNGRRTVKQWLQVANEIGTRIADKSDAEIEKIAYRSWFEEQPTKNITRYDNQAKTNVGFQKLTSDEWLNTINNAVNEARTNNQAQSNNVANNQEQNNVAQNGNMEQILPTQKYYYKKSDNVKIDNLRQDVNKYFDNSEKTHNFVNMLEKIIEDKDISIRLDENLTDTNGNIANGKYENGTITINPNSDRAGEFIAIHELTHAIGTDSMRSIIEKYRKSNTEFDNAVKSLLENYNTTELTDEAMADVSAQLFGNQEYINNLAQENPNLFKRIYNEIKYLWHQFRGYKNQNEFIEDLQYKWEQAYRDNDKLNNTTNYSIQQNENGRYIKVDTDQDIFNGIEEKDYNKIAKMYMQDYLKGNTKLSENDNATIGSKGINKYTNPKQQTKYMAEKMQLTPELKNVLEIAEKVQDSPPTKDTSKYSNWEYYKFNFELGGKPFEGLINIGIDKNGNKHFYEINKIHTTSNSYVSTNKSSSTDSINNSIPSTQENVNSNTTNYSMQESEKNSGSFSLPKEIQDLVFNDDFYDRFKYEDKSIINETIEDLQRQQELLKPNESDSDWDKNFDINQKIKALRNGYDNVYDYLIGREKQSIFEDYKYNPEKYERKLKEHKKNVEKQNKLQKEIEEATSFKREQYEIIQKTNPMFDDVHTGIRSPADIKTFKECIENAENDSSFEWGDYTLEDAQRDLKRNKVRIYSSYAIKNGVFVSTSYQQALDYAGGDRTKVHSREVNPNKVAWINGDEGQYASTSARYSKNNQEWQEYLDKNIESKGTKTNLKEIRNDNIAPEKELNKNNNITIPTKEYFENKQQIDSLTDKDYEVLNKINENNTQDIAPVRDDIKPTKGETINWNEIERPEGKIRKHYRSIIESSNTTAEAKAIAKEMMGLDTYTPQSNESLLQKADSRISTTNPETELKSLLSRVMNNEKVNDVDMAVGERLIEYYSKIGDSEHLQDAIHATALAGTQAGRTVQAMALLNHMTPQGQVVWLERSVNKANKELEQKFKNKKNIPQFELTSDMTEKILNTKSKEEMYKVLDDVYEKLGQQVPKTTLEKIDEWRYFSMLANVKTHGRNMIGNVVMNLTQRAKNKIAGAIEGTVAKFNPEMERTHTIVPTSKKVKDFAKNDVKNMDVQTELGMNENKYNPQSRLQSARRTFKSDVLENTLGKMFDLNSKLLEVEDNIGLKSMYVKSLGEYITANKIDIDNMTDAQLSKARQHAIKEAQEATFHQASALATALNQMGRKNNIAKFALDSAVPFKKTPINVAKTGVQYSPVGLIKSAVYDVGKLRKGDITVNQYIDNVSKGLTGTGIAYLGYALAQAGILKASGSDDDKKEKYEEEQGKQSYSIEIGGKTYSLDWLSPVGIPLFIGAEINQQFNTSKKEKNSKSNDDNETLNQIVQSVANIANASANAMNPMSEMSMISGLTNVLSSYNKENAVGDMIVNTGKSYINQFVPTALGQLARTTDDYERTTKSTKTGALEKAVDSTINQIKSKIPGLRQTLPTKTDIWGKEVKQSENLPFRAFNNFINPSKVQDVSTDKVDKELNSLYAKTGESSIIPKAIDRTLTIDKTNYRLTNEEYAKYYKNYGKTSYNLIKELINSSDYKNLTDEQKQKAIENVYSYAKESNKLDYAKDNNITVKESTLYKTMNELKDKGGKQSSYINYMASTSGMTKESEKNEVLLNSNYDSKTKSVIYSNGTGKDDNLYNNIKNSNIDINEYLKYKTQDSNGKFSADKDSNGKSISGTAKEKVYNYVNNNITGYNNRLLLLGQKYKLSKSEQENLAKYIYQISTNSEEKNNLFEYYSKNFTVNSGKIYYK